MPEMEYWSWPPRYDDTYRPEAGSRHWFKTRETMDPGERERAIVQRLREVCRYAYERSPFYRMKWDEAGFHPDQIRSLEDFESRCPVIKKADLRKAQERAAPSGATTGRTSPTRTRASCGRWASGRRTWSSSPRSSASTWEAGARSTARSD